MASQLAHDLESNTMGVYRLLDTAMHELHGEGLETPGDGKLERAAHIAHTLLSYADLPLLFRCRAMMVLGQYNTKSKLPISVPILMLGRIRDRARLRRVGAKSCPTCERRQSQHSGRADYRAHSTTSGQLQEGIKASARGFRGGWRI